MTVSIIQEIRELGAGLPCFFFIQELKTIVVDKYRGHSTRELVVTDRLAQTADGRLNDTMQGLLVNRHLDRDVRRLESQRVGFHQIRCKVRVGARVALNVGDWAKCLEQVSEDDNDEELCQR